MQELEAKFLTTTGKLPEAVLRRLQESLAWAGFRIQPQGRTTVTDVYFDTPDQQLRTAGWSYRTREDPSGRRIALKELNRARAAIFDRQEVEQPIAGSDADLTYPGAGPVGERLSNLLHPDARLQPLFTVRNERAAFQVSHPNHPRGLVEMAFDDASINAKEILNFNELEIELKTGHHSLLADVLATVELEPDLFEARLSKYQRGLIAANDVIGPVQEAPPASPQARWLDVAATHLQDQLRRIRLYEPYAWEALHTEGVHQMRVATRQARAALRAFSNVLPADPANRLAPQLRWLAAVLGEVRDLDVHLDGLTDYRSHLEAYEQTILDRYQDHLLTLRTEAHGNLIGALDDAAFGALIKDFRALLAAVATDEGPSVTLEEVTGQIVRNDLPRFREHGRSVDVQSSDKALHRLRIDGKRLRYQLEFLSGAYGAPLANAIRTLKRLQNHLGGVQDAHVARTKLGDYRRGYASGAWAPRTFKRLVRLEKRRGRHLRRRVADDWAAFESAAEDLLKAL